MDIPAEELLPVAQMVTFRGSCAEALFCSVNFTSTSELFEINELAVRVSVPEMSHAAFEGAFETENLDAPEPVKSMVPVDVCVP